MLNFCQPITLSFFQAMHKHRASNLFAEPEDACVMLATSRDDANSRALLWSSLSKVSFESAISASPWHVQRRSILVLAKIPFNQARKVIYHIIIN
jgi:hypothetical protein